MLILCALYITINSLHVYRLDCRLCGINSAIIKAGCILIVKDNNETIVMTHNNEIIMTNYYLRFNSYSINLILLSILIMAFSRMKC